MFVVKAEQSNTAEKMGRDEEKHISCGYVGNEENCPNECGRCAIAIKTDGDMALAHKRFDDAIRLYKKAIFIEPKFTEAWANLGNAYGMNNEYNNSLYSFEKALSIDPVYGKAMFGKAITLSNLNRLNEAAEMADSILTLYPNANEVQAFKTSLGSISAQPLSLEAAIEKMTVKAYNVLKENCLLAPGDKVVSEDAILCQEDYSERVLRFCTKLYASFGQDKVFNESIVTAFYGSLCSTLFFYEDKEDLVGVHPFEYLANHSNLEDIETVAEQLLGIRGNDKACSKLWDLIYNYARYTCGIIEHVAEQDKNAAAQDATESAYTMGMMYAMNWHERQTKPNSVSNLNYRLDKIIASIPASKLNNSINRRFLGERIPPRRTEIRLICEQCQHEVNHMIVNGHEMMFDKYQELSNEFTQLGFNASVSFFCSECAKANRMQNSYALPENILFSISFPDGKHTVESHPVYWCFRDTEYRTALAFLKGADTIDALSETTKTDFQPEEYIKQIRTVLGKLVNNGGG